MYNDSLKSTVEANQIAITALESQLKTVNDEVLKEIENIQSTLNKHLKNYNKTFPFIPSKMLSIIKMHISGRLIRANWTDYSRPERTNSIDIYYYNDKNYENQIEGNHRWEISCSSYRLKVNTTAAGWKEDDGEELDRAKLVLGLYEYINTSSETLINLHNKHNEAEAKHGKIYHAIEKLKRGIEESEKQMKYNDTLRLFKPGGQTAICKFNKDIPAAALGIYAPRYSKSGRRRTSGITFDAIRILKETAKGLRVEFIRYGQEVEGQERQSWTNGTKWVSLDSLISLYQEIEQEHNRKLERDAERESLRLKRELEEQTK